MKKPVCVDLDGVLADYSQGWQGIDKIGQPLPGAVDFVRQLSEKYRVIIFTTRCKTFPADAPIPDGVPEPCRDSEELLAGHIRVWLKRHGFPEGCEVYTGQGKPFAVAYVDDRAVECVPQHYGRDEYTFALKHVDLLAEDGYWHKASDAIKGQQ